MKKLNANPPTITVDELREKARARATVELQNQEMIQNRNRVDPIAEMNADADFRTQRLSEYEALGDWDDAGDKAILISLVEHEVQFRSINRDLSRATTDTAKEKLRGSLVQNGKAITELQKTLGIDKKSREQARTEGNPIDNWATIKEEIGDWVDQLVKEFVKEAKKAKTEGELRDLAKYKLSWPFEVIDAFIDNLKRVSGASNEEDVIV